MVEALFEKIINQSPKIDFSSYDADSFTLTIAFTNRDTLQYFGVPEYIANKFQQTSAKNEFYNKYIKGAGFSSEYL